MTDSGSSPSPDHIGDKTSKRSRRPDIKLYIPPGGKRASACLEAVPNRAASSNRRPEQPREPPAGPLPKKEEKEEQEQRGEEKAAETLSLTSTFKNVVYLGEGSTTKAKTKSLLTKNMPTTCAGRLADSSDRHSGGPKESFNSVPWKEKTPPQANTKKFPRPDPTKLPEQQIAEMLKRYNIQQATVSQVQTTDVSLRPTSGCANKFTVGHDDTLRGSAVGGVDTDSVSSYSKPTVNSAAVCQQQVATSGSHSSATPYKTCASRSSKCSDLIDFSNDDVFWPQNELRQSTRPSSGQLSSAQYQNGPCTSSSSDSPSFYSASTTCCNSASNLHILAAAAAAAAPPTAAVKSTNEQRRTLPVVPKSVSIQQQQRRSAAASDEFSSYDDGVNRLSIENSATGAIGPFSLVDEFGVENGTSLVEKGCDAAAADVTTTTTTPFDVGFTQSLGFSVANAQQPQNDADQILSSLPKSYDEFVEVRELNGGGASPSSSGQPRASSSSCALIEIPHATSSSPSNVDPDDLEVQQINESFEEQLKQAQVLSNLKVKEAFYKQPNRIDHVSSGSVSSDAATVAPAAEQLLQCKEENPTTYCASQSRQYAQSSPFIKSTPTSLHNPSDDPSCDKPVDKALIVQRHTVENTPIDKKAPGGLTWAGWGTGGVAQSADITVSSMAESGSEEKVARVSQKSIDKNVDDIYVSNPDLDCLSKEMIDKVLFDDDNDVVGAATCYCSDSTSAAVVVELPTVQYTTVEPARLQYTASAVEPDLRYTVQEKDEECKLLTTVDYCSGDTTYAGSTLTTQPATVSRPEVPSLGVSKDSIRVIVDDYLGTSMTSSSATAVVEEWEHLADADFIPIFKTAVNKFDDDLEPPIDYLKFNFKRSVEIDDDAFGYVLEAYGFTPSVRAEQLHAAMQHINCKHYNMEWVDDTHALVILTDQNVAFQALQCYNPVIKLRPLQQASAQSRKKVKEFAAQLRPCKPKPETNAFLARKLVENHLGKKSQISENLRQKEKLQLQNAKENKRLTAQLKEDAWEGNI